MFQACVAVYSNSMSEKLAEHSKCGIPIPISSNSPTSTRTSDKGPRSLTYLESYELFINSKKSRFNNPELSLFSQKVEAKLAGIFSQERHAEIFRVLQKRHKEQCTISKNKRFKGEFWQKIAYSSTMDDTVSIDHKINNGAGSSNPSRTSTPLQKAASAGSNKRKPLLSLSKKQMNRRIDDLYSKLLETAEEEDITPTQMAALLLSRAAYSEHKDISHMADKIVQGEFLTVTSSKLSIEKSVYLLTFAELGRRKWTGIKALFKSSGNDVLPPYSTVAEHIANITPEIKELQKPYTGVRFPLLPALRMTIYRQLTSLDLSSLSLNEPSITFTFKVGFDGSGGHNIFHQIGSTETNNIIMCMLSPLSIGTESNPNIWIQPNPSSSTSHRPLILQMGKENIDNLQLYNSVTKEMLEVEKEELRVMINDNEYRVKVIIRITGLDRKAADAISGLGGAFCDLCTLSRKECHDPDRIADIVIGGRTIEDTQAIAAHLMDTSGVVKRKQDDYEVRKGVMRSPTTAKDIESVQCLHLLLRTTDWCLKLVYHEIAGVNHWSEGTNMRDLQFIKNAKLQVQAHMQAETGLRIDFPDSSGHGGTTTTGNVARQILYNERTRSQLLMLVPNHRRPHLEKIMRNIAITLRVATSTQKVKDLGGYKDFCLATYRDILTTYPYPVVHLAPSVHKLLGHAWELIECNDGYGLGILSEGGIEASNKLLRRFRVQLSRKTSQFANLTDCCRRLWINGDPVMEKIRNECRASCTHCGHNVGHGTRYCPNHLLTVERDEDSSVKHFLE